MREALRMGAVFPVAHVPRGEAAAQSPTNGPLPRDWKLLGVGSQSRHHGVRPLGKLLGRSAGASESVPPLGWVFELSGWTLQQRQTGGGGADPAVGAARGPSQFRADSPGGGRERNAAGPALPSPARLRRRGRRSAGCRLLPSPGSRAAALGVLPAAFRGGRGRTGRIGGVAAKPGSLSLSLLSPPTAADTPRR